MNFLNIISQSLFISKKQLLKFAFSAPNRYKVYQIPKKNSSGNRTIAHPSKELKIIQRLIAIELENILPIHQCVFSYRKGKSIKNNAQEHLNSRYLLKMDFENFFPSITPDIFFKSLTKAKIIISEQDKELLSSLLFWRPIRKGPLVLSIGAPTSPLISNFIMKEFDEIIYEECVKRQISYTRYADDIIFSTNKKNILFDIPELVSNLLNSTTDGKIKINSSKTVFSSKAHNRHVTGVTLTNDNKLSIGRNKKRIISSMIHKFSLELLEKKEIYYLKGILAHISNIEPIFIKRMENKYGHEVLSNLKKFNQ